MPRVLIYGAGAIGSMIGYLLSEEDETEDVALLGRTGHIQRIREDGLRIDLPGRTKYIGFRYCFSDLQEMIGSGFAPEIVMISVKTYSLDEVCRELEAQGVSEGALGGAAFVLLMNGMGNLEVFSRLGLPSDRVYEGVTSIGVTFPEDGRIELRGMGRTVLEDRIPERWKIQLSERFHEKGFEIEFASDFREQQWRKLIVNAVINPITALTRERNGIVTAGQLRWVVERIVAESLEVARREGVQACEEELLESVLSVAGLTSENTSSMLQDVQRGRRTEIDSITGYLTALAERHRIDLPVVRTLHSLVRSLEMR